MKRINLTDQELQVLLQYLDVAVRARGMDIAANAVHLAGKLAQAEEVETEENTDAQE